MEMAQIGQGDAGRRLDFADRMEMKPRLWQLRLENKLEKESIVEQFVFFVKGSG
jgi:hypothetical protein